MIKKNPRSGKKRKTIHKQKQGREAKPMRPGSVALHPIPPIEDFDRTEKLCNGGSEFDVIVAKFNKKLLLNPTWAQRKL